MVTASRCAIATEMRTMCFHLLTSKAAFFPQIRLEVEDFLVQSFALGQVRTIPYLFEPLEHCSHLRDHITQKVADEIVVTTHRTA